MSLTNSSRSWLTALVAGLFLSACAMPDSIKPGTAQSDVLSTFGKPESQFDMPDGGKRFEYNRGEWMQRTWMVDFDRDGRVARVDQVRDEAHFARLQPGTDNKASVHRALGTPMKVEYYPPSKLTGWLYPYRESGVFNSVMTVMFDPSGVFQRAENGPDPRFLGGKDNSRQ
jgi:outer membrane protein assembly factor BamE (lipoprotein component of BamABCDE complex)